MSEKGFAAGIAASVIGGLAIWWLTSPGGPLKPLRAEVVLSDFDVPERLAPSSRITANFTVYNNGDGVADECRVSWIYDKERDGDAFRPIQTSRPFSLVPKESKQLSMVHAISRERTYTYMQEAQVQCRNDSSTVVQRKTSVISEEFFNDLMRRGIIKTIPK
jgi:hypothetical protein